MNLAGLDVELVADTDGRVGVTTTPADGSRVVLVRLHDDGRREFVETWAADDGQHVTAPQPPGLYRLSVTAPGRQLPAAGAPWQLADLPAADGPLVPAAQEMTAHLGALAAAVDQLTSSAARVVDLASVRVAVADFRAALGVDGQNRDQLRLDLTALTGQLAALAARVARLEQQVLARPIAPAAAGGITTGRQP